MFLTSIFCVSILGQLKVAISIDDVPNTSKYERDCFQSVLLDKLDSLKIPVSIFINEGLIYKTIHVSENFDLLNRWAQKEYVTLGNHGFSHLRYSEVGIDSFTEEIDEGDSITRQLSKLYNKKLFLFRMPYNDLGKDSLEQSKITDLLESREYLIAPFTIESSDWMFNYLYEYYLRNNKRIEADSIAQTYLEITIDYFAFFDSLALNQYGRRINQIYLCHDNSLNADYFEVLIERLSDKGYSFISIDEALKDDVYTQSNCYNKKWGISWMYRWMKNNKERIQLMQREPDFTNVYERYESINSTELILIN